MNNSNRKKRRQRSEVARAQEESRGNGMADHRGGMFMVMHKETKEKRKGLNWQQAYDLWHEWNHAIILEDDS